MRGCTTGLSRAECAFQRAAGMALGTGRSPSPSLTGRAAGMTFAARTSGGAAFPGRVSLAACSALA